MANDALIPNTVKTMVLMLSAIFNVRNTFTVAPAAPLPREPYRDLGSGRLRVLLISRLPASARYRVQHSAAPAGRLAGSRHALGWRAISAATMLSTASAPKHCSDSR